MPIIVYQAMIFLWELFIIRFIEGVNNMAEIGTLDLIEQITRLDGTKYYEIGNMVHNGRAELAAERGFIKEVRILKLNIPHSQTVIKYEQYVNEHYQMQDESMDHWEEWPRDEEADEWVLTIVQDNHVG